MNKYFTQKKFLYLNIKNIIEKLNPDNKTNILIII